MIQWLISHIQQFFEQVWNLILSFINMLIDLFISFMPMIVSVAAIGLFIWIFIIFLDDSN